MFEPVHGSAPDIMGRGIANPMGTVWAGVMMLEHLGETAAAKQLMTALETVAAEGRVRTPDLGGTHTTTQMAKAITETLSSVAVAAT
jgi:tartrate dehydrogenase/decarboxylase/D-malate dehydrogenase